jgi:clan AA aspartic protease
MGFVHANIALSNPRYPDSKPVAVKALVDSAAYLTCIPEELRAELRLDEAERRPVQLADGSVTTVPYVGPILLRFENRQSFGGALVMGNEVLIGTIAMEDMDVLIEPRAQKLIVNPEHPDRAQSFVGVVKPASNQPPAGAN